MKNIHRTNTPPEIFLDTLIANHPYVLLMKGAAEEPSCGFSYRVVEMLQPIHSQLVCVNILEDEELRQAAKAHFGWPTFPQFFHNGTFVGGCDILEQMQHDGTLATLFTTLSKKE